MHLHSQASAASQRLFCFQFHEKNFRGYGLKTVATLGASEGGARHEVVGGIGPKGRSFTDYIP